MNDGITQLLLIALAILILVAIGFAIYKFSPTLVGKVKDFMSKIIKNSTDKGDEAMSDDKTSKNPSK